MRTARLLTVNQYALPGGVPARGCVYLPGGCTFPGGVPTQVGVPARGVYLSGGVPAGVCVPVWGCTCRGGV